MRKNYGCCIWMCVRHNYTCLYLYFYEDWININFEKKVWIKIKILRLKVFQRISSDGLHTIVPFMSLKSRFYLNFILILFWFHPDFIQILFRFYPDFFETNFIQILSTFYLDKIMIKSRLNLDKNPYETVDMQMSICRHSVWDPVAKKEDKMLKHT